MREQSGSQPLTLNQAKKYTDEGWVIQAGINHGTVDAMYVFINPIYQWLIDEVERLQADGIEWSMVAGKLQARAEKAEADKAKLVKALNGLGDYYWDSPAWNKARAVLKEVE